MWVSETCSLFFLFSLCSLDCMISINIPSSWLILLPSYFCCWVSGVNFSFQLLYFSTPEFSFGSFLYCLIPPWKLLCMHVLLLYFSCSSNMITFISLNIRIIAVLKSLLHPVSKFTQRQFYLTAFFLQCRLILHYLFEYLFFFCWILDIIICLFIYLFLAALGLCCCAWAFSSCGEWELLFVEGVGFSLRWLLLLQSTGSRRAGFSSCGAWA